MEKYAGEDIKKLKKLYFKLKDELLRAEFRNWDGDVSLKETIIELGHCLDNIISHNWRDAENVFYDKDKGDEKLCECGHHYYRHFDTYDKMEPIGCKYCGCFHFEELKPKEITLKVMDENDHSQYVCENGRRVCITRYDSVMDCFGTYDDEEWKCYWWNKQGEAVNHKTKSDFGNVVTKEKILFEDFT